jgi:general nucleoside transport system permease protein
VSTETVSERVGTEEVFAKLTDPGGGVSAARTGRLAALVGLYLAAVVAALAVASVLIVVATDAAPVDVYQALYEGSLSRPSAIGLTLDQAMPILIVALGAIISSRAGMFNIGPEGQLIVGAVCGAFVAFKVSGPPAVILPLSLAGAALGGLAWAGIAAGLRMWRGVDVVISTLLLNFIAIEVLSFAINKSWLLQETTDNTQALPQSDRLAADYQLTRLGNAPGFSVSSGIFIALALVIVVTFVLARTRWGFRLKMLGLNPSAARTAGVNMAVVGGTALLLSGGFAGLAGGVMFTGTAFRIQPGISSNVGFDGLLVALIARRNALATVPVAFAFGMLRAGGGFLAATGVPRYLVDVVQALIVLAALLPPIVLAGWERRRALRVARREAAGGSGAAPAAVAEEPALTTGATA